MIKFNYRDFGLLLALAITVFGISGIIIALLKFDQRLPTLSLLGILTILAFISLIIGSLYLKSKK